MIGNSAPRSASYTNTLQDGRLERLTRELYNAYTGSNPVFPVARALSRKFLTWDEVREDCRSFLRGLVDHFTDEGDEASGA
jgi:hypothetical protein